MKKLLLSISFIAMLITLSPLYGIGKHVDAKTSTAIHHGKTEQVLITASNNMITIEGNNAFVRIYDLLGTEVKKAEINGRTDIQIKLKGIYLVKVNVNGNLTTKRVYVPGALRAI